MSLIEQPGTTIYPTCDWGASGASIGFQIRRKSDGVDVVARTTVGVVEEFPGVYTLRSPGIVCPTTIGQYEIASGDGVDYVTEDLDITYTIAGSPLLGGGRSTMGALITRVRRLSGDLAGATQVFSDAEIQEMLDATRTDVRYLLLQEDMSVTPASLAQYLAYYDPRYGGGWEDDVVLTSGTYAVLTPSVSDALTGKWTFAASTLPPVFLTGKVYDVYEAAGDLCEQWAARAASCFDFETDGQSYKRSQKTAQLHAAASNLRMRARPRIVRMVRRDAAC